MNKDLFFLGIQGCGKGTQGKLLLKEFDGQYDLLEMGQLFRAIMSNDNIIGNFCKNIVNNGKLVPHFVSHDRFHTALQIATTKNVGLMVDGFPRAMEQAQFMESKMKEYGRDFVIIHFELSKEKAIERIQKRATIEGRADDTTEAINTRIDAFIQETLPVIKYFEGLGKVISINADDAIEKIEADLRSKLGL
ncbi:MAG: nucleoside monophosphate kinase [bacterium]